jgi:hypothetical protein
MTLHQHVKEMRALAKQLTKYSFPLSTPQDEETISCLKQREIAVDGYDIVVYFNRCRYLSVELETIQIFGKYFTFLPFSLVCKVANSFLGDKELSLVEVMHCRNQGVMDEYARKIYVWTVYYDDNGKPTASPFVGKGKQCDYQGLRYNKVNREQIVFF